MKLYYLAFSARGLALAQTLAAALGGEAARCGGSVTLHGWTEAHFRTGAGLVYVGACGIAVRAVGPLLRSWSRSGRRTRSAPWPGPSAGCAGCSRC